MYSVVIRPKARKELLRLSRKDRERMEEAIDTLSKDPFVGKKLKGDFQGAWTFRVGPYRIIYTIEQNIVTVTVLKIAHRKDVYR